MTKAVHGGDVFAAARELGVSWRDILDFSASINPLGPPPGLKEHLFDSFDLLGHYPDPLTLGWRTELARIHGLSPDEVVAGNGTTALMYLLARVLRPQNPVMPVPAFAEYGQAVSRIGVRAGMVACSAEEGHAPSARTVDSLFALEPDLIFLAQPTSPAGSLVEPEILSMILDRAGKRGIYVLLDEAFLDFTSTPSLAGAVGSHKSLIVLRSMTKFYALPGLRLGYLTASADLTRRILARFEPWSVNSMAQAAGLYCLDQDDYAGQTRELIDRERAFLADGLERTGRGRVIPGRANYLLMQLTGAGPAVNRLSSSLRRQGILIRDCASFGLDGHIRVAVKTNSLNRRLISAMGETAGHRTRPEKIPENPGDDQAGRAKTHPQ